MAVMLCEWGGGRGVEWLDEKNYKRVEGKLGKSFNFLISKYKYKLL